MSNRKRVPRDSRDAERAELRRRLAEAEQTIQTLAAQQIDAVPEPGTARPVLLQRAQEALRQSESRQRLLLEQLPAIVWTADQELRVTSAAGASLSALGRPDVLPGTSLLDLPLGSNLTHLLAAHREALEGRSGGFDLEWAGRTFQAHVEPLRDAAGQIVGCLGLALDISARRQAEAEREEALSTLRERVKELTLLQGVSRRLQEDRPLPELLAEIAALLPSGWRDPERAAARITLDGREYTSPRFGATPCAQRAERPTSRRGNLVVEVCYREPLPAGGAGPFLAEEQALLDSLAEMLVSSVECREADSALHRAHARLEQRVEQRTAEINRANAALQEEVARRTSAEEAWHTERDFADAILDTAAAPADAQGTVEHLVAAGIDITDRRQAEIALQVMARFPEENPNPVLRVAQDGVLLYANLASLPMLRAWGRAVGEPVPQYWREVIAQVLVAQSARTVDTEVGERVYSVDIIPIAAAGYVNLYARDVTQRRLDEETLRQSEAKFRQLFDALPVGVSLMDEQRRVVDANPALARILRMPHEGLLTGAYAGRRYIRPDRSPMSVEDLPSARVFREQRAIQDVEIGIVEEGRDPFWVSVGAAPLAVPGISVVVTVADITERKQSQEALRKAKELLEFRVAERTAELREANRALEQEIAEHQRAEAAAVAERQRFNDVLETLPAYVVLLTPEYHATFANRVFRERFGESQGRRCYDFLFHRDAPCEGCETYRVLDTGAPHHWEWIGPDNREYDVYDFPFADADGSYLILEMGLDITERNRAERALREANETLERRVVERTADLAASEKRFRGAIENMPDVLVIYDRDLRIQYINTATRAVTGRVPSSYIGKRDDEIWPAEVCEVWLPTLRAALETGEVQYLEADLPLAEGNRRALQITCVPLLDEQGQVQEVLGVTHDLTARRRAEETLRASEERLARAQEIAHLGSWELDLASNTLVWSEEVYRIFGLQPLEFEATYEAFLEHVHPDDRAAVDAAYSDSVRESRDTYELEHRVVHQLTGEVRIVHEKCEHQRDNSGRIARSVGMVHDITERKRAEELLRASEERFRGLYTSMIEGVALHEIIYDAQGQAADYILLDVNPAYERITGLPRAQVVGQLASTFYGSGEPPYLETYAQVATSGQPAHFEAYFPPMEKHFRISVFALEPGQFATVFDDITERKGLEQEREQRAGRLTTLLHISQRVLAETTIPGLLQSVVDAACELVGAGICIAGHGYQQGVFQVGATSRVEGVQPCPPGESFVIERGGIYMRLIEQRAPLRLSVDELEQHLDWWGLPTGHVPLRGLLGTPLFGLEDQPMGLIMASDKRQGDFTPEDELLLTQLATVASLGLRHIQARTDVERRAGELDAVFASIADGVVVYGLQGEIVNINAPARELLGYEEEDIARPMAERVSGLGVRLADGSPLTHVEQWPSYQALQGHTVRSSALSWAVDPDEPPQMVLISAAPICGAQGHQLGAVATLTDVSELRAAQKQLEQVNAELAQQAEKLERRNRNLRLLNQLSQELGAALELSTLLDQISRAAREVFPADGSIVWLRDPVQVGDLVCQAASYVGVDQCDLGMRAHLGEGLAGWVGQQRQSVLVNNTREDARFMARVDAPHVFPSGAVLAAAMTAHEEVLGVLEVVRQKEGGFDAESLILLETLAAAAAIALENIHLHKQARETAVLGERSRLARELHDAVSQTLFSASVIAESLPRLWERKPERVRQGLEQLHQLTRGALSEMRTLLLELRPTALAEGKIPDLLQQLVDAFTSRSRVQVTLAVDSKRSYPPNVQIALYRIAQEALNNVSKHARAARVEISLRDLGPWVEMRVRDNGRGFSPQHIPPDRLGLGILRERAEAIGATLQVSSQEGVGTEVLVVWPANQEGGSNA